MPIGNITQSVSVIPAAGKRGIDVQTIFVTKQEDFQDALTNTFVTEINTLKTQFNARAGEINSTATTINNDASTATTQAGIATTKANAASASASTATTKASEASASAASINPSNLVNVITNQIISGVKTFNSDSNFKGIVTINSTDSSATLGTEMLTNGTFTGNTTGWVLGTNWAYSSNNVVCTLNGSVEGTLSQNVTVTPDSYYLLEWSQTNSIDTNGQVTPSLGAIIGGKHSSATTTKVFQTLFRATASGTVPLTFTINDITSTGSITLGTISLKKLTPIVPSMILPSTTIGERKTEIRTTWNGVNLPNIGIGWCALQSNTTGYNNTANGAGALQNNTTGYNSTANGVSALQSNTTGYSNTANGAGALQSNTTGYSNTANGVNALYNNTTGYNSTANGVYALQNNTTGYSNTANGVNALYNNTTGYNSTANGVYALQNNTTGYNSTANGVSALQSNTTGYSNTANGVSALQSNTTGYSNTANGVSALLYNTTGYSNTANGAGALQNNTTFSNISGFGYNAQVTGSNQVQLGDSATTTYVYGTVANRSDIRDKADIRDTVLGLEFIRALRPVDYKWDMREDYKPDAPNKDDFETDELYKEALEKWLEAIKLSNIIHDGTHKRTRYHQGFIAQEVMALGVEFGGIQDHSIKGGDDVLSIGYDELIAPMVKAIQEQQNMISELILRVKTLEEK